jgi:hypothetical protein
LISGSVILLLATGCGGTPSAEEEILLEYLAKQAEATSAVLDGDQSDQALARVNAINAEHIRYYTTEPGDPEGEWVYPHGEWLSSRANCDDHLRTNAGLDPRRAQELCQVTFTLLSRSADLDYWFDEANAAEDEYWDEDRPDALDETRQAVERAKELL